MSKSVFSIHRIRLLLRQEWAEQGRFLLFVLLGLTLALVGVMLWGQNQSWAQITRSPSYNREELAFDQFFAYINSFFIWLIPTMTILPSLAFGAFRRKENARWYLSLPTTQAEKWLSKVLIYLLMVPLVLTLIYLLVANVHLAFLSTSGYAIRWVGLGDLNGTYPQPFLPVTFGLLGFFFLMAVWQPRFSWVKGIVAALLLGFLLAAVQGLTVKGISGLPPNFDQDLGLSADIWELTNAERSKIQGLIFLGFGLFGLTSLLGSYFALREKQT